MLAGMKEGPLGASYEVWLMRQGDRVLAGTVRVDDKGWGTSTIWPKESLFGFDKVELVSERGLGAGAPNMVLEANIPALKRSQLVILMPVR